VSKADKKFIRESRDALLRQQQRTRDGFISQRLDNEVRRERQTGLSASMSDMEVKQFAKEFLGVSWDDIRDEAARHTDGLDKRVDEAMAGLAKAGRKWTKKGRTEATKKVLRSKHGKVIKKAVQKRKRWFW
jgi:hypothetical protein